MKVLVTGAYGNQGQMLIPKLAKAGVEVRAVDFNPDAEKLYDIGAKEVIIGDLRKDDIIERAVTGVDTVYLLLPSFLPRVTGMSETMIEIAERENVKHFVFSSCLNAVREIIQHWEKYIVESALMGSSLNYTILKPCGYMEVHFPTNVFESGLYTPLLETAPSSFISVEDITDAACKVILEGEPHYFASYDLCSRGNYDSEGIISLMKQCFKDNGLKLEVTAPVGFSEYHSKHPYRGNSFVFEHLMGRQAMTLEEYFRKGISKFH